VGELVRVERRDAIAIVTINRPEVRNALNPAALADLRAALEFVGRNPAVACAILAGEGGTFTTGDDLTETAAMEDAGFADMIEGFQSIHEGASGDGDAGDRRYRGLRGWRWPRDRRRVRPARLR